MAILRYYNNATGLVASGLLKNDTARIALVGSMFVFGAEDTDLAVTLSAGEVFTPNWPEGGLDFSIDNAVIAGSYTVNVTSVIKKSVATGTLGPIYGWVVSFQEGETWRPMAYLEFAEEERVSVEVGEVVGLNFLGDVLAEILQSVG